MVQCSDQTVPMSLTYSIWYRFLKIFFRGEFPFTERKQYTLSLILHKKSYRQHFAISQKNKKEEWQHRSQILCLKSISVTLGLKKNRPIDAINSRFSVVAMLQVFKVILCRQQFRVSAFFWSGRGSFGRLYQIDLGKQTVVPQFRYCSWPANTI